MALTPTEYQYFFGSFLILKALRSVAMTALLCYLIC
jgi:hypothetical protein